MGYGADDDHERHFDDSFEVVQAQGQPHAEENNAQEVVGVATGPNANLRDKEVNGGPH